jgi:nucleoside-diphosphate-sugar epimerase
MKKLLIVGFGDIARRVAARLPAGVEVRAVGRRVGADLDRPPTLAGIAGWADAVLHCAPPPGEGVSDPRTANLLAVLDGGILPSRFVYLSTSGVYGDCGGALVDESRPVRAQTARAKRRVDAERRLTEWCGARGVALVILRVPGIYAPDRLPIERLRQATPVLRDEDDVMTNHIHADDLAAAACRALEADAPAGVYNVCDDTRMRIGEWLDFVADRTGLARPPRVARAEAERLVSPTLLSFMSESRRLDNRRMKERLGLRLRYPTVHEGVPRLAALA